MRHILYALSLVVALTSALLGYDVTSTAGRYEWFRWCTKSRCDMCNRIAAYHQDQARMLGMNWQQYREYVYRGGTEYGTQIVIIPTPAKLTDDCSSTPRGC